MAGAWRSTLGQRDVLKLLERSLDPTEELLRQLQTIESLSNCIDHISSASTTNDKAGRLLTVLMKMKSKVFARTFPVFLDILRDVGQDHIANVLTREPGQQPMSQRNLDLLDKHADKLHRFICPFEGLLIELRRTGVFRDYDNQRVIRWEANHRLAVEEILNIIKRKPDSAFAAFKEALKATDQSHVVFILTDGEDGRPPPSDEDMDALERNRFHLIETIEPQHSGLLDWMQTNGAFSSSDSQRILERGGAVADINCAILNTVERKSQQTFDKFLEALTETDQGHLSNLIRPNSVPDFTIDLHLSNADDTSEMAMIRLLTDNRRPIADLLGVDVSNVEIINKCIELSFRNMTMESLSNLMHLVKSKRLEAELNQICEPVLTRFRLKPMVLPAAEVLDRIRCYLRPFMLMSQSHIKALQSPQLIDQIKVNRRLLNQLSMRERLKDAIEAIGIPTKER
jgi:hypothetical protein